MMPTKEQLYFRRSKALTERIAEKLCEYPLEELDQYLTTFNFPETKIFIEKGYTYKRMCNLLAYYLIRFSSGIIKKGGWTNNNGNRNSSMDELLQTVPESTFSSHQFYWKHLVDLIEIKDIIVPGTYDALKWFESDGNSFSKRDTFVEVGERILAKNKRYFDETGNFDITKIDVFSNDLHFGGGYSHIPNLDLLKTIKKNMDIEKSTSQEYQEYQTKNNSDDELLFEEELVL
jgi:hypothetical protein